MLLSSSFYILMNPQDNFFFQSKYLCLKSLLCISAVLKLLDRNLSVCLVDPYSAVWHTASTTAVHFARAETGSQIWKRYHKQTFSLCDSIECHRLIVFFYSELNWRHRRRKPLCNAFIIYLIPFIQRRLMFLSKSFFLHSYYLNCNVSVEIYINMYYRVSLWK